MNNVFNKLELEKEHGWPLPVSTNRPKTGKVKCVKKRAKRTPALVTVQKKRRFEPQGEIKVEILVAPEKKMTEIKFEELVSR